jgi:hypothetical protein
VLHEAVERAAGLNLEAGAKACRELGFIDVQAGRRDRAALWRPGPWRNADSALVPSQLQAPICARPSRRSGYFQRRLGPRIMGRSAAFRAREVGAM